MQRAAGSSHRLLTFRGCWQQCPPSPFTSVGGDRLPESSVFASVTTPGVVVWEPSKLKSSYPKDICIRKEQESRFPSPTARMCSWVLPVMLAPHPPNCGMVKPWCGIFPLVRSRVVMVGWMLLLHTLHWSPVVGSKNSPGRCRHNRAKPGAEFMIICIMKCWAHCRKGMFLV